MPVSPHLHRKLQETLGADAADDLVERMEGFDAIRGDVRELRHEVQLVQARFEGKLAEAVGRLEGLMMANRASMEALLEKGLREQTRFFFLAWSVLLASVIGLYGR